MRLLSTGSTDGHKIIPDLGFSPSACKARLFVSADIGGGGPHI